VEVQRKIKADDLPFSFPVPRMAKELDINVPAAYALTKREDFKASIKIGKRIIVIRDLFLDWLEREAAGE